MIVQSPNNPYSHLTIKEREWPSFPTKRLLSHGLIRGRVLDFGCGTGVDVAFLRGKGHNVIGFDPYYAPDYPSGRFDTILCHYVLNVLLPEEQVAVLMAVSELLEPGGKAYFTVRRDIKRNGFRVHSKHNLKVYQCNVVLPFKSLIQAEHCEVYEYQHFNQIPRQVRSECPFCHPDPERELLSESAAVYALLDKYPVSPGHALIIPKQHVSNYFELSDKVRTACWLMVARVQTILLQRFQPEGFNVGINVGAVAGQTVPHVHIHLIPRYLGDVPNPAGGVRNVIPDKGNYLHLYAPAE
ncbi:MAG: HIT domain-containing protein [Caldilineaceae bacterium]|nr:HIT domain-containing protein [Caldilineaceae bacterium]